jgi:hypothetical protein
MDGYARGYALLGVEDGIVGVVGIVGHNLKATEGAEGDDNRIEVIVGVEQVAGRT